MADGSSAGFVAAYKTILRQVLDNRPSGTRLKLAAALGKNRSFVSQITNAAYPVAIPAQHIETIFEVCHLSPAERMAFLDAYRQAHPRRLASETCPPRRALTLSVPDLGDAKKNRALDQAIEDLVARFTRYAQDKGD
jgi:hypothetical protein